jgi:NADP+-dependent farnesol dehydrogenase
MTRHSGIIVGGSSGVGFALAQRLVESGSAVTVLSRGGGGPEQARRAIADIRDFAALERAVAEAIEHHPVNFVVNCAGVGFYAPMGEDHSATWNEILETNVTGVLNLISVVERVLDDLADFVHVSSMAAHRASATPGNVCYSAAKAAARVVVEEHRRLSRAAGRSGRVSMISPGFISDTEFGRRFFERAEGEKAQPLFDGFKSLAADEVAALVEMVLALPPNVEVGDFLVRPTEQPT